MTKQKLSQYDMYTPTVWAYNLDYNKGGYIIYIVIGIVLVLSVIWDVWKGKIPNLLTGAGIVVGIAYRVWQTGISGLLEGTLQMLIPVALLYLMFRIHALGAGDIKLFMAIACMSGQSVFISIFLSSFMVAAIYAIIKLAVCKELIPSLLRFSQYVCQSVVLGRLMPYPREDRQVMHFAVSILAGYILTMGVIWCSN